jgi:hypothetical protein
MAHRTLSPNYFSTTEKIARTSQLPRTDQRQFRVESLTLSAAKPRKAITGRRRRLVAALLSLEMAPVPSTCTTGENRSLWSQYNSLLDLLISVHRPDEWVKVDVIAWLRGLAVDRSAATCERSAGT